MKRAGVIAASIAAAAIAVPVFAGPVGLARPAPTFDRTQAIAQLQHAQEENLRQARMTHGSAEHLFLMKAHALADLILRIDNGEQVSRREVERAIGS